MAHVSAPVPLLVLARIIHERFCCNRGFAALAREASFLTRRSYLVSRISSFASIDFPACEIRFTIHGVENAADGLFQHPAKSLADIAFVTR